jgi:hypothetical protein
LSSAGKVSKQLLLALKKHIRTLAQCISLPDRRVTFSAQTGCFALDPLSLFDITAQKFVSLALESKRLLSGCRSCGVYRRASLVPLSDERVELI